MKRLFCLLILLLAVPAYGTDYYVDVANGSDGNTGLSEEQAFASLAKAADMVDDGGTVYVQATGSYTAQDGANNCVLYADNNGVSTAPITWIGYVSDVNDGGIVTIDASTNSLANCVIFPINAEYYNVFKNFRFTGASGDGVGQASADKLSFINCSFDNNGGNGINLDNNIKCVNCVFYSNGSSGWTSDIESLAFGCIFHNNGDMGIDIRSGVVLNCLLYGNANTAIYSQANWGYATTVISTTVDANSHIGIHEEGPEFATSISILNTIIANASVGIDMKTAVGSRNSDSHNLFYNNTTNVNNWPDPTDSFAAYRGSFVTATDPFTNAAAHGYSLASGSAAIEAGADASFTKAIWDDFNEGAGNNPPSGSSDIDLGAIQEPAGAGGAGGGKVIGKSVVQ